MLDHDDADQIAQQFGVAEAQVRRDHLISHLLGLLSARFADDVVFFGGTALSRTHLPEGRLSEDIDLICLGTRSTIAPAIDDALATGVRREFGRSEWLPPLGAVRDTRPGVLRTPDGLTVRIQLVNRDGHPTWPTERLTLVQRYRDAPEARLDVPTLPAFAASKTATWIGRHAARDLYDLCGLARIGAVDAAAGELFTTLGPTGRPPRAWMFDDNRVTSDDWVAQLAGQTQLTIGPQEACRAIRDAWRNVYGEEF